MQIDRDALQGLLVEHLEKLRAFVRLRMPVELRQRERESDVLQVACLHVLERGVGVEFRSERALLHWFYGAVENSARDLLRRQRADCRDPRREVSDADSRLLASYATFCTPSRIAAAREEVQRVEAAIDLLSDAQREVVTLSCLLGLSHDEIAAETGMSLASVRTHLHRGLAQLALRLEGSGGQPS